MRLGRTFLLVLIPLAAAGAGWLVWSGAFAPEVAVSPVTRGDAAEVVYATGTVEPERWAKVVALQRKRIVSLCSCEGAAVTKGQVLGRLDDGEERAALAELEARRRRLEQDVERIRGLVARNAATQTNLDQTKTQLDEYEARIVAQQERIGDLQLRAPMDGFVLRQDGEVGEVAGTGAGDVLFWVGQKKPLRIVADVNEDDIPRVRTGQKTLVRSEGFKDQPLDARVADITPKGDPATKTFRVYLALPDDTPLRIGMSVEANIVTREKSGVLLAPTEALLDGHMFRLDGDRLQRRAVRTGIRAARKIEIEDGLAEGDLVAAPPPSGATDGMRVRAKQGGAP